MFAYSTWDLRLTVTDMGRERDTSYKVGGVHVQVITKRPIDGMTLRLICRKEPWGGILWELYIRHRPLDFIPMIINMGIHAVLV